MYIIERERERERESLIGRLSPPVPSADIAALLAKTNPTAAS